MIYMLFLGGCDGSIAGGRAIEQGVGLCRIPSRRARAIAQVEASFSARGCCLISSAGIIRGFCAKVAELVDALDLGSSGATRESSSLSFRTRMIEICPVVVHVAGKSRPHVNFEV